MHFLRGWRAGDWGVFIECSLARHLHFERFCYLVGGVTLGTRHMVGFQMVRGVASFCNVEEGSL